MITLLFEQFLKERTYIKNVSQHTLEFYRSSFKAYQKIINSASVPTKADLTDFVIGLREKGLKPVSCNTRIRGINSFLSWLYENGHTSEHLKIKQLKCEQRVMKVFSDSELKRIISYKPKKYTQQRIHTLVLLALDTGSRINELLMLTREDVDMDNLLIKVIGKGSKERVIPISREMRKTLYKFLKSHDFDLVFCTKDGLKLMYDNARRDYQRMLEFCGVEKCDQTFHSLRRCFAKNYARNGGNLFYLMKTLGHADLQTTACGGERLLCVEKAINQSALCSSSTIKAVGQEIVMRENRRRYGSRRIQRALARSGVSLGRASVRRLMKEEDLKAIQPRRFQVRTTDSRGVKAAPNLLAGIKPEESGVGKIIVGDITYIRLRNGKFCYLAVWQDKLTRRIVGWSLAVEMTQELVISALQKAIGKGLVKRGAIIHSDRGSQYASNRFRELLSLGGLLQSMSGKGNCYDNAQAESFFSRFKTELIEDGVFEDIEQARSEIFSYIEGYYNRVRLHSSLGYLSPLEFEMELKTKNEGGKESFLSTSS